EICTARSAFRLDSRLRGNDASGPIIKGRVKILEVLVCRMNLKNSPESTYAENPARQLQVLPKVWEL
ncbi:MAG: hypothetical protein ABSH41_26385, partial [Syntrophobacteraceae bacterium]